jgi:hypothetical protein
MVLVNMFSQDMGYNTFLTQTFGLHDWNDKDGLCADFRHCLPSLWIQLNAIHFHEEVSLNGNVLTLHSGSTRIESCTTTFSQSFQIKTGRGNSLSAVASYGFNYLGSNPGRNRDFFFVTAAAGQTLGPTQTSSNRSLWSLSNGVKRPEREANISPVSILKYTTTDSQFAVHDTLLYPRFITCIWCSVVK